MVEYEKSGGKKVFARYCIDEDAYIRRVQTGPCFICEIVAGNPDYPAHIVYEDDVAIAFLDKWPRLYGWTLVAPREHREQVTGDFSWKSILISNEPFIGSLKQYGKKWVLSACIFYHWAVNKAIRTFTGT